MAPTQSNLPFSSASGYETDDNAPRRSGRITTPARLGPGMICPPSDSRQALPSSSFTFSITNEEGSASSKAKDKGKGKRARSLSIAGSTINTEDEDDTDVPEIISGPARKIVPAPRQSAVVGPSKAKSKVVKKKSAALTRRKDTEAEVNLVRSHFDNLGSLPLSFFISILLRHTLQLIFHHIGLGGGCRCHPES